ncbi:DUF418 domain-containing protein [Flavobacterium sp. H122]|uniref:DUF418 domain-containing protein n=1 Tax=Flavobacterium sp. H122 TaxID=2529860 RepID=UPI0010AB116B|nr:DUF418 domain-containing protein [Flavobacterium sp. H122]
MQTTQRVEIIDVLRGWALFVVVISNYLYFGYSPEGKINGNEIVNTFIETLETYLFSAKGWTLLFVLFGFGFGVIYEKRQQNTHIFLFRRMLVLSVFALFNSILFDGDILRDYAFLGLLFLFFIHLSAKKLMLTASIMFLIFPFLTAKINTIDGSHINALAEAIAPLRGSSQWLDVFKYNLLSSYYYEVLSLPYSVTAHFVMFACMLFGLALQKSHFFVNLPEKKKLFQKVLISSLTLTLVMWGIFILSAALQWSYLKYFSFHYWLVIATMLFTASGIVLLYINNKGKALFKAFSHVGKMTFTNYIVQNIISFIVFQGAGLRVFHHLPFYFYFVFAIVVYCLQTAFSYWWLQSHTYGPFEWLWRKLSATGAKTPQLLPIRIFVRKR